MEFSIEFYETGSGRCPVREFLDDLKESDPGDFAAVMAGLTKLQSRHYHRPPLSKHIGDDLFELRHVGKLNSRVLYFFMKGKRIIALHGIRSKAKKIFPKDRKVALDMSGATRNCINTGGLKMLYFLPKMLIQNPSYLSYSSYSL